MLINVKSRIVLFFLEATWTILKEKQKRLAEGVTKETKVCKCKIYIYIYISIMNPILGLPLELVYVTFRNIQKTLNKNVYVAAMKLSDILYSRVKVYFRRK